MSDEYNIVDALNNLTKTTFAVSIPVGIFSLLSRDKYVSRIAAAAAGIGFLSVVGTQILRQIIEVTYCPGHTHEREMKKIRDEVAARLGK